LSRQWLLRMYLLPLSHHQTNPHPSSRLKLEVGTKLTSPPFV
jgi:hypothetical protein